MVPSVFKKKGLKNFLLNVLLTILQPKTFLPVYIALQNVRLSVNTTTHLIYKLNVSLLSHVSTPECEMPPT